MSDFHSQTEESSIGRWVKECKVTQVYTKSNAVYLMILSWQIGFDVSADKWSIFHFALHLATTIPLPEPQLLLEDDYKQYDGREERQMKMEGE